MHKYLPSKKFIYILLSIILALGIIYLFSFLNKQKNISDLKTSAQTQTKIQEFLVLDSDSDGLKDWEEALWKTDPQKIDTDGDGTTDGEEARLNRNPLVANTAKNNETPTDQADMEIIAAQKKAEEEFAKLSQTEQLSRTFFSQYIASKNTNGASISDTNKQIILDTAISMTQEDNLTKYILTDIKTTTDIGATATKKYGNDLAQAFYIKPVSEEIKENNNESEIINRAIQTEDEEVLNELDPIIKSYDATIKQILLIDVPKDTNLMHLKFLNDLNTLKTSFEDIKFLFSDPVRAIVGISKYQNSIIIIKEDLNEIKKYFLKKNINFIKTEYGYFWINII